MGRVEGVVWAGCQVKYNTNVEGSAGIQCDEI